METLLGLEEARFIPDMIPSFLFPHNMDPSPAALTLFAASCLPSYLLELGGSSVSNLLWAYRAQER